jgi:hypothetical protein
MAKFMLRTDLCSPARDQQKSTLRESMSKMHVFASMKEPVLRDFELFVVLDTISDTARRYGSHKIRRQVTGKIRGRGPIWHDFMSYWTPLQFEPIQFEGQTYYGVKNFIKVDCDFYSTFTWLNIEGNTLRMILTETHHGTLEQWRQKKEKRIKRVQDYLKHVHSGQFTRNDYRELMAFERLQGAFMDETFSAQEMQELLKGIEKFPIWKRKTQNVIV